MKRFTLFLTKVSALAVILVLLFSPFAQTLTTPIRQANAQTADSKTTVNPYAIDAACNTPEGRKLGYSCYSQVKAAMESGKTASEAVAGATSPTNHAETTCGISSGTGIANCVAGFIYIFTVGLGSAVAFIASYFLNFAVTLSLTSGIYAADFVSHGWTTARDVANMGFIFILIYLAIVIMLNANTAGTVHSLASVIFMALIINFSFFFTRVVIDMGNILSVQLYNAIAASAPAFEVQALSLANQAIGGSKINLPDITAGIMRGVNIQSALNSDSFAEFARQNNTLEGFLPYLIALCMVFISVGAMFYLLATAFITAGVKFLIRIVVLWLLIITSPLALVARTVHPLEEYYKKWQSLLISHTIFPIVFLFILYILSQFMASFGDGGVVDTIFASLNASGPLDMFSFTKTIGQIIGNIGVRLGFVLVMLYYGLKGADEVGVIGSNVAANIGKTWSFGGARGYANMLNGMNNRFGAGRLLGVPDSLLKNTRLGNATLPFVGISPGTELRRLVTKPLSNYSLAGLESRGQMLTREKAEKKERTENIRDIDNKELVKQITPELISASQYHGLLTPQEADAKAKAEAVIDRVNNLSTRDLGALGGKELSRISNVFTNETQKKIHNIDSISEADQDHIHHGFHEGSPDSPLMKSHELVNGLRQIDNTLHGVSMVINGQTVKVTDILKKGQKVDKDQVLMLKKIFNNEVTASQVKISQSKQSGNHQMAASYDANKRAAQDALKEIEKLGKEMQNIPAGIGGDASKGAFKAV